MTDMNQAKNNLEAVGAVRQSVTSAEGIKHSLVIFDLDNV